MNFLAHCSLQTWLHSALFHTARIYTKKKKELGTIHKLCRHIYFLFFDAFLLVTFIRWDTSIKFLPLPFQFMTFFYGQPPYLRDLTFE